MSGGGMEEREKDNIGGQWEGKKESRMNVHAAKYTQVRRGCCVSAVGAAFFHAGNGYERDEVRYCLCVEKGELRQKL